MVLIFLDDLVGGRGGEFFDPVKAVPDRTQLELQVHDDAFAVLGDRPGRADGGNARRVGAGVVPAVKESLDVVRRGVAILKPLVGMGQVPAAHAMASMMRRAIHSVICGTTALPSALIRST